ncbi:hypothetical protein AB7M47_003113 [Bradyrhizobium elkanii]
MAKEFSAATAAGHCNGENRALWQRRLEHLLPKTKRKGKVRRPHPSLPYEELSALLAQLTPKTCISARMLETCILTCARLRCGNGALPLRMEALRKISAMR